MRNWLALGYSFGYVFLILILAEIIARRIKSKQISRKIIHILCGNWILIAFAFFDSMWAAIIPPISFIFINYLSYRKDFIPAMEGKKSLGTVYYAVSLLVLTAAAWLLAFPAMAYVGILSMAYGDGFAAVLGEKFGRRKWELSGSDKSYVGSAAVFALTTLVVFLTSRMSGLTEALPIALLCGLFALYIELYGVAGYDNLTLPLGTAVLYFCFYFLQAKGELLGFWLTAGISAAVLAAALRKNSITGNGAGIAFLVGALIYTGGGLRLYVGLILFFVIGSISGKWKNEGKRRAEALHQRKGARGCVQVLANSAAIIAVLWMGELLQAQREAVLASFAAFAAAAADTVSSDLGMLTRGKTFSLLTGRLVEKGLSGGVSVFGLLCGFFAAGIMVLPLLFRYRWQEILLVIGFGFLGTLVDSVLGDALQVKYLTEEGRLTEVASEADGKKRKKARGFLGINNDIVNFVTASLIALLAFLVFRALGDGI